MVLRERDNSVYANIFFKIFGYLKKSTYLCSEINKGT